MIALPPDSPPARDAGEEITGEEEPDAGPACVPAIGRTCPPVRSTPSILLDPDLTPTDGGFPAISRDGAAIAIARIDPDGARGAPNLTIVLVRTTDGSELHRFPILEATEAVRIEEQGEAALANTVRARVRAAQTALDHGHFESLDGIAFASRAAASTAADGRGLHLTFDAATHAVTISDSNGERGRSTLDASSYPDGAWTDPGRHTLVLRVARANAAPAELVIPLR